MSQISFMADYGARLVDNGYPVIPIMPGAKIPGRFTQEQWTPYPDWTRHCDRPTKGFEIDIWRRWPGCAVGIACGAVVGVDIDVLDAEIAHKLQALAFEMLGETSCIRIGLAPKRMLVYRAAAPFRGIKRHPIEILARGQQFVAYAIHPDTQRPYDWPMDSLLDRTLDSLPVVDEAKCAAFAEAGWRSLPQDLQVHSLVVSSQRSAWAGPSDLKGTREAIESALAFLPNDELPWGDWFRVGMALKGALGDEGRDIFLAWSAQAQKNVPANTAKFWQQAKPHSLGAGTIYWLAEQRGWKPEPHLILNGTMAELASQPHPASELLNQAAATAPAAAATAAATPPYRVPPRLLEVEGTLRIFVEYATRTAASPQPFLALGAAICMVGALAGRRYRTPTDLRSNVYAIGIADSGGGKDHARRCVKRVLYAAGLDRYLGGEDLASSAGLLTSLQRHPARLFQVDEFGQFLKLVLAPRAPAHKAAIWTELTKLYTSAAEPYIGAEYADQKTRPRVTIEQPCACIWGVTVPRPFWQALEGGALADGSIARFLVFLTDEDYPERNEAPAAMDPPADLVAAAQAIARGVPGHNHGGNIADLMEASAPIQAYTVPLTADAAAAMARVRRDATELLRSHRGTYATAMFGRYAENTAKLAMIAAIGRDPAKPVTEAEDVVWASALVEHCISTLLREADRFVADNPIEAKHKKVLEIIRSNPGIDGRALSRKTQFLTKRERLEIVDALIEGGQIVRTVAQSAGAGRPGQRFWLATPSGRPGDFLN